MAGKSVKIYTDICPSNFRGISDMTGSLQKKTLADGKEYYYMVLNFYDRHTGKRKPKWIPTELPVKGNKRKAEQLLHMGRYMICLVTVASI